MLIIYLQVISYKWNCWLRKYMPFLCNGTAKLPSEKLLLFYTSASIVQDYLFLCISCYHLYKFMPLCNHLLCLQFPIIRVLEHFPIYLIAICIPFENCMLTLFVIECVCVQVGGCLFFLLINRSQSSILDILGVYYICSRYFLAVIFLNFTCSISCYISTSSNLSAFMCSVSFGFCDLF